MREFFEQQNFDIVKTREPGGGKIAEQIRDVLKDGNNGEMSKQTEILLFSAARSQHADDIIRPVLNRGGVVICDRFYDSSLVYQGKAGELGEELVKSVTKIAIGDLTPDVTFYLSITPEEAFKRKNGPDNDRFERAGLEYHEKVKKGYDELAEAEPKRIKVIDASRTVDEVFTDIISELNQLELFKDYKEWKTLNHLNK